MRMNWNSSLYDYTLAVTEKKTPTQQFGKGLYYQDTSYKAIQSEIQLVFLYLLNIEKIRLKYKRKKGTT